MALFNNIRCKWESAKNSKFILYSNNMREKINLIFVYFLQKKCFK